MPEYFIYYLNIGAHIIKQGWKTTQVITSVVFPQTPFYVFCVRYGSKSVALHRYLCRRCTLIGGIKWANKIKIGGEMNLIDFGLTGPFNDILPVNYFFLYSNSFAHSHSSLHWYLPAFCLVQFQTFFCFNFFCPYCVQLSKCDCVIEACSSFAMIKFKLN